MSSAVQQSLQLCPVTFDSNSACLSIWDNWTLVEEDVEDDMVSKTEGVERNAEVSVVGFEHKVSATEKCSHNVLAKIGGCDQWHARARCEINMFPKT